MTINTELIFPEDDWLGDTNNWENAPGQNPVLIEGLLREGHKLLITGDSKAAKTAILTQLAISIAEGKKWLGTYQCHPGKVYFINFEVARPTMLKRFKESYEALNISPENRKNITLLNLNGYCLTPDELELLLIQRVIGRDYKAIILDPIYGVVGDENNMAEVKELIKVMQRISKETGAAVIYSHHHAKGEQAGKKTADRGSGSGVWARSADAILDVVEIEVPDNMYGDLISKERLKAGNKFLEDMGLAEFQSKDELITFAKENLDDGEITELYQIMNQATQKAVKQTAWITDCITREFQTPKPEIIMFNYPVHYNVTDLFAGQEIKEKKASSLFTNTRKRKQQNIKDRFDDLFKNEQVLPLKTISEKLEITEKSLILYFGTGVKRKEELKTVYSLIKTGSGYVVIKK